MNSVAQEDPMGCGIACVGFVLNISYQEALNLFPNSQRKARKTGFLCKEIVKVLNKQGLKYQCKYIKDRFRKKIYRPNSIIFLKRSKEYPAGHYLARSDHSWMDPWINFPKENIKAGFRKKLLGKPIYIILKN